MIANNTPYYAFPEAKSIVVSGDIHGEFNLFVNKICVQYQMRDTLVIVAGDCGFGFERKGSYDNMVKRNAKRMNEANNWIVFVRGNHDNPAYFDGASFKHKRFMAIPDYSVVEACSHTILCVGGAISIDRRYRMDAWENNQKKLKHFGHQPDKDAFAPNYYWPGEAPFFNPTAIEEVISRHSIDTVITHTAPSFCEMRSKDGLCCWSANDPTLLDDVKEERLVMDELYNNLLGHGQSLSRWCYGHFHQSWQSSIDGCLFKMLDIMELYEIQ